MSHQVRTLVAPVAAMSENVWSISAVVRPVRPTQYELALENILRGQPIQVRATTYLFLTQRQ